MYFFAQNSVSLVILYLHKKISRLTEQVLVQTILHHAIARKKTYISTFIKYISFRS